MAILIQNRNFLLNSLMHSLEDLHEQCGGIINHADDNYDPDQMDAFDTKTLQINAKIGIIRREIIAYLQLRHDTPQDEISTRSERIELMLESVNREYNEMKAIHEVESKPVYFTYKPRDSTVRKQRQKTLKEIQTAIQFMRSKFTLGEESEGEDDQNNDENLNNQVVLTSILLDGIKTTKKMSQEEERKKEIERRFETGDDCIDITAALRKRRLVSKKQDDKMREVNKQLDDLLEKNQAISDSLDEGNRLLESMHAKADRIQNDMVKIHSGLDKAQAAASGQVKFVICALCCLFAILVVGIGLLVIVTIISPPV